MNNDTQQGPPRDEAPHPADQQRTALEIYTPTPPPVTKTNETSAAMVGSRARAEIEARTIVALQRPRDMRLVRAKLLDACTRFRFADAAMYEKPLGDKKSATGLSIRFAEEAARHFGNVDISITVISDDDDQRVLEAVGVDLEANLVQRMSAVVPKYVERRSPRKGDEIIGHRTNSTGATTYKIRAHDDALFTATQAMAAKLRREVILMLVPADIKEECEEAIGDTLREIGNKDPEKYIQTVVSSFEQIAVTADQLTLYLGKSPSQMSVPEAQLLRRLYQSIRQGDTTWADVIEGKRAAEAPAATEAAAASSKSATDRLRQKADEHPA